MLRAVTVLIATIGGLLCVLVGLVALSLAVAVADGRVMAFMIEEATAMVLGRSVEIGRARVADWGWPVTIELTDIAVENAAWADDPKIARAERVRATVGASGLFPPSVKLPHVTVTAPAVSLTVNAQGEANWQGLTAGSGSSSGSAGNLLGLRSFHITDGSLTYRDAGADGTPTVRLHGLSMEAPAVDQPITFKGSGRIAAGPAAPPSRDLHFSGEAGSLNQLRRGELPVKATASAGTARAEVSGRISDPLGERSMDLRVLADGEDLRPLLALAGTPVDSTPPFHAEAHVVKQGTRWTADGIQARLGESRLEGTLTVDAAGPKPMIVGELVAPALALEQLRGLATQGGGTGQGRGGEAQGLPFGWLRAVNADLMLRAERIAAPGMPLRSATASLTIEDGTLRIDSLRIAMAEGSASGTLRVDATADPPAVMLKAEGKGVPVGVLPVLAETVDGTVEGTAELRSEGRTLGALLENLTGTARASIDGQVQGQPMHLTLRAGTSGGANAVPVELSGEIGTASVRASGTARVGGAGERVTLHLHSEGPEIGPLLALAGVESPPQTPPYSIDADVRVEGARVRAPSLTARLGETRVEGTASAKLSGARPMLRADLTIPRLGLDGLRRAAPDSGAAGGAGGQVIPPVPLPFGGLRSLDADVAVRVGEVSGTALPAGGARVEARLKDGVLRLDPVHLDFAEGGIGGTVTADANPSPPTLAASIDLDAVSMDAVMSALQVSKRVEGRVNGAIDVRSAGRTLQDVSENLDGTARFSVTEGQFTTRLIDTMAVNIGEALGFLFSEGETRRVDCVVGRFDIENGTIDPETMVFVTPDMVLRGKGRIDLAGETIDMTLVPRPKERHLLDVTVPVEARGPLADPRIDIGVSFWTRLAKDGVCRRTLGDREEDQAQR